MLSDFLPKNTPIRRAKSLARFVGIKPTNGALSVTRSVVAANLYIETHFHAYPSYRSGVQALPRPPIYTDYAKASLKAAELYQLSTDSMRSAVLDAVAGGHTSTKDFKDRVIHEDSRHADYQTSCDSCQKGTVACSKCGGHGTVVYDTTKSSRCTLCDKGWVYAKYRNGIPEFKYSKTYVFSSDPFHSHVEFETSWKLEKCPRCVGGSITSGSRTTHVCSDCKGSGSITCPACRGTRVVFQWVKAVTMLSATTKLTCDPEFIGEHFRNAAAATHNRNAEFCWKETSADARSTHQVQCDSVVIDVSGQKLWFLKPDGRWVILTKLDKFVLDRFESAHEYIRGPKGLGLKFGRLPGTPLERHLLLGSGTPDERIGKVLRKSRGSVGESSARKISTLLEPIRLRLRSYLILAIFLLFGAAALALYLNWTTATPMFRTTAVPEPANEFRCPLVRMPPRPGYLAGSYTSAVIFPRVQESLARRPAHERSQALLRFSAYMEKVRGEIVAFETARASGSAGHRLGVDEDPARDEIGAPRYAVVRPQIIACSTNPALR